MYPIFIESTNKEDETDKQAQYPDASDDLTSSNQGVGGPVYEKGVES
jgi:hypothetical protein